MALRAQYLADKRALSRLPEPKVQKYLLPLLEGGLVATCAIIDLEVLYSARSLKEYESVVTERLAFEDIPITRDVTDRAIDVQHELAKRGQHRVSLPDLLIAAAAELAELTLVHYDADFERIAGVTGQVHEWVAKRGSI